MVEVIPGQAGTLKARNRFAGLMANPPTAAVLAVGAAVLAFRRAGAWTNPQFWAEDNLFYERAYVEGWHAFWEPISGYLHLVLRAIAWAAACADPALAPWIFVGGAAVATLYVVSRALSARCPLPRYAGACALAVVLVPDAREVLLNVVNLQWVLGAGLILLLISRDPGDGWGWAHDLACAAAIGLTGPFCIILAPLFLLRAARRRTRPSFALAVVILACAVVQAAFVHGEPPASADTPGHPVLAQLFLPMIARRIGGSLLLGSLLAPVTDLYVGTAVGIATLAAVAFLALRPGAWRIERLALGLAFAGLLLSVFYRTRHSLDLFFIPHARARYVYLPQLLAIWLLVATAAQRGRGARIAAAVGIWALLVNLPRLREPAYADMHWSRYAPMIRAGQPVTVPTNMPGLEMHLPGRKP
jgi:hypothetical protein